MNGPELLIVASAAMFPLSVAFLSLAHARLRRATELQKAAEVALAMAGRSESPSDAIIYTTLAYDLISIEWRDRAGIHHSGHLCPAGQVEIIVRDTP